MNCPLSILLVDDSPADRQLAQAAFDQLAQPCAVHTAESGQHAPELLQSNAVSPDLTLLDIHMPGMTGFELLSVLKAHAQLRAIPVIMLTTSVHDGDVTRAYTLRANAYLNKSIHFDTFLDQLEKCVGFWTRARLTTWPHMISG